MNIDTVVQRKEEERNFDKEWSINRTKQFYRCDSQCKIVPTRDGSWTIVARVGNNSKMWIDIHSDEEFYQSLWDARVWMNEQCPTFEGAVYPWPTRESCPYTF